MATVNRYRPNVDYTLAEQVDDGGKVAFIPSVNVASGTLDSDVTVVGPLGSGSAATSVSVTDSTEDVARIGVVTETAPATDTASSGLNGRLQRIAQRLTSLIALVPASLGRKSSAASFAVVQAGLAYETVAASQTDQVLGTTGAAGDYLSHLVIQPVTTGAGAVTLKDGASTIYLFTSGTLGDLSPMTVPLGIFSAGALSVTTGANVTVLAVGNFT